MLRKQNMNIFVIRADFGEIYREAFLFRGKWRFRIINGEQILG